MHCSGKLQCAVFREISYTYIYIQSTRTVLLLNGEGYLNHGSMQIYVKLSLAQPALCAGSLPDDTVTTLTSQASGTILSSSRSNCQALSARRALLELRQYAGP